MDGSGHPAAGGRQELFTMDRSEERRVPRQLACCREVPYGYGSRLEEKSDPLGAAFRDELAERRELVVA